MTCQMAPQLGNQYANVPNGTIAEFRMSQMELSLNIIKTVVPNGTTQKGWKEPKNRVK